MLKIFIAYRREASYKDSILLRNHLTKKYGKENVFLDIEDFVPGEKFETQLLEAIDKSDVFLILLDNGTLERIHEEYDWLRREIDHALKKTTIRIIPILVNNFTMPSSNELPPEIQELSKFQSLHLNYDFWDASIDQIIKAIGNNSETKISSLRNYLRMIVWIIPLIMSAIAIAIGYFPELFSIDNNNLITITETQLAIQATDIYRTESIFIIQLTDNLLQTAEVLTQNAVTATNTPTDTPTATITSTVTLTETSSATSTMTPTPTVTLTITSSATSTVTPTIISTHQTPYVELVSIYSSANIRSGPGMDFSTTGDYVLKGEKWPLIDSAIATDGTGEWWLINKNGNSGWICDCISSTVDQDGTPIAAQLVTPIVVQQATVSPVIPIVDTATGMALTQDASINGSMCGINVSQLQCRQTQVYSTQVVRDSYTTQTQVAQEIQMIRTTQIEIANQQTQFAVTQTPFIITATPLPDTLIPSTALTTLATFTSVTDTPVITPTPNPIVTSQAETAIAFVPMLETSPTNLPESTEESQENSVGNASLYPHYNSAIRYPETMTIVLELIFDEWVVTPTPIGLPNLVIADQPDVIRPPITPTLATPITPPPARGEYSVKNIPSHVIVELRCLPTSFVGCEEKPFIQLQLRGINEWEWTVQPIDGVSGKQDLILQLYGSQEDGTKIDNIPLWSHSFEVTVEVDEEVETPPPYDWTPIIVAFITGVCTIIAARYGKDMVVSILSQKGDERRNEETKTAETIPEADTNSEPSQESRPEENGDDEES